MAEDQGKIQYVTLVSRDGYEFIVRRSAACISGTISKMLDVKSKFRFNDILFGLPLFVVEKWICQNSVCWVGIYAGYENLIDPASILVNFLSFHLVDMVLRVR